jgi:hypothetical protein
VTFEESVQHLGVATRAGGQCLIDGGASSFLESLAFLLPVKNLLYIFCAIVVKLPSMAATGLSKQARSSRPRLAMKAGGEMPDASHGSSGYSVPYNLSKLSSACGSR